jgi:hypothetical protein
VVVMMVGTSGLVDLGEHRRDLAEPQRVFQWGLAAFRGRGHGHHVVEPAVAGD